MNRATLTLTLLTVVMATIIILIFEKTDFLSNFKIVGFVEPDAFNIQSNTMNE